MLSNFKKYAKRTLAGILTAALILTSGAIPNSVTGVQAATVYDNTTTALSELSGSTGLKMYELTSSDAGAQLSSGIYYINSDLTLNADKSHYNGLKIAENATAYIYIPEGTTLTVYGQDGANATNGGDATEAKFVFGPRTFQGVTYSKVADGTDAMSGTAGSGAKGGGAAIYVPASAKLVLFGGGTLKATGGKGGNAGAGGLGSTSPYYIVTLYRTNGSNATKIKTYKSKSEWADSTASGTATNSGGTRSIKYGPGAGGAGGGGAAGGGAAVGTNGWLCRCGRWRSDTSHRFNQYCFCRSYEYEYICNWNYYRVHRRCWGQYGNYAIFQNK